MYTNQLENCLQSDPVICKQYGGVWALDQLPKFIDPLPCIYVINTQESTNTHSGHWVSIFSEGGQFDFFDSYGKNPDFYSTLLCDFMQNTEGDTRVNRKRLQATSSAVCGHYCLYFAFYRCRGKPLKTIVQEVFTSNFDLNDLYVYDFVRSHFIV